MNKQKVLITIVLGLVLLVGLFGCSPTDPIRDDLYTGNIYPASDNVHSLGDSIRWWKALWVGTIYPPSDNTGSLGGSELWWNELYVDTIYTTGNFSGEGGMEVHAIAGAWHGDSFLANLNDLIIDATLDDSSSPRPPTAHTIASHSDTTAIGAELDELTGGGVTSLHTHPVEEAVAGDLVVIKAGTIITDGSGIATVTFNTSFLDAYYAIALTANVGNDVVICQWDNRTANSFTLTTNDDGGKVESGVEVFWIAITYNNP